MPRRFIHVTDPPIVLGDGESLIGQHVTGGGATYGRVLFVGRIHGMTLVEVRGHGVSIIGNRFDTVGHCPSDGTAVRVVLQ
jgi:hypothetical protein